MTQPELPQSEPPQLPLAQREFAIEVVKKLRAAGYQALWAGGCVRDQLLGSAPKDYDVAASALPQQVREIFGMRRTLAIGASFGVITVLGKKPLEPIEVATFRSDGDYKDGRRPAEVHYSDAEADAERRDFTINGIFYDPIAETTIDYVGGEQDIEDGVVRAIGDPYKRFNEDKLRLLRAVRFAARLEFEIESNTMAAIQEMADQVEVVSAERIGNELTRILTHPTRPRALRLLEQTKLLAPLFPEIRELPKGDPRAWEEFLRRLERLESLELPTTLAAVLLWQTTPPEAKALCRRLRLTNETRKQTAWLLEAMAKLSEPAVPWPALQRLLVHPQSDELLTLCVAALPTDHPIHARIRAARMLPPLQLNPPPLVTGDDLIAAGITPGKRFAALLEYIRDEQLDGRLTTPDDAIQAAKNWLSTAGC